MIWLFLFVLSLVALYFLSQGAPYVPTLKKDAVHALDLMNLKKGATIVDVGSGDGAVLKVAAERGYRAVGIELNPLLWAVAMLRLWKYRGQTRVVLGNAWQWHLPKETKAVFLFTAGPFVKRMVAWLEAEQRRLKRPIAVVSLGFHLPGHTPVKTSGGCVLYHIS